MSRRTLTLQPVAEELERVRANVTEATDEADFSSERCAEVRRAVAEATGRAIERARGKGSVTVAVGVGGHVLTIEVSGPGQFEHPLPRSAPLRGMSLPLLAAMADEVTLSSRHHRTSVILVFNRSPERAAPGG